MGEGITALVGLKVTRVGLVDNPATGRTFAIIKRALPFADLPVVDAETPDRTDSEIVDGILGPNGDNFEAMDNAYLWRDDEAIAERDDGPARGDYKLLIAERDDGDVLRVYYSKLVRAFQAINGARSPIAISIEDAERAFEIGVRYVRKLNEALPEDEQKPIPEFAGVVQGADDMADQTEKQEDGEEEEVAGAAHEFPAIQAVASERVAMAVAALEDLKGFADMTKDEVSDKLFAMSDMIWGMHSDLVMLAKSQGLVINVIKQTELGDFLREARDEAEITNEELAEAADISVGTVAGILAGDITRPPDDRLRGFASVLPGVSFQDLLDLIPSDLQEERTEVVEQQEGQMADDTVQKSAEVLALEKSHGEELKKQAGEIADLRKNLDAANDKTRLGELTALAKSKYPSLGDAEKVAKRLQKAEKDSDEELVELEKDLAGWEAKAKAGLDSITKRSGRREIPGENGGAASVIEKRIDELMKDGTVETVQKGWAHIAENQPELIEQNRDEEA